MAALTPIKPISNSSPSKKVRLVAKIRRFTQKEQNSEPWITVDDTSDRVVVSFADRSNGDSYEVDSCYGQSENNFAIYSQEIKPLLSSVCDGLNLTVIGFGARGSGKTYTIHGNEEEQGFAALATNEILSVASENGISVFVSLFEVYNEHVYDLLDPKHPEVQVLEAQGKITLKGLSEDNLESVSEFYKLYSLGYGTNRRSHKGLILKFSSKSGTSSSKVVGKMTFVDLAGYEDARRKSCEDVDIIENGRISKSLYALLNVVHAINANESRVPFRESKLTRMLQDSFGTKNRVLLLNCLNPIPCQDTIFTLRLASRSCKGVGRMIANSVQKSKYLGRSTVSSVIKGKLNIGSSAKKQVSSTPFISVRSKFRKVKERKIDDEGENAMALKQLKSPSILTIQSRFLSEINSEVALCLPDEEKLNLNDCVGSTSAEKEDNSALSALEDTEIKEEKIIDHQKSKLNDCVVSLAEKKENSALSALEDNEIKEEKMIDHQINGSLNLENTPNVDESSKALTLFEGVDNKEKENDSLCINGDESSKALNLFEEVDNKEKENDSICINGDGSPPLSSRIRELTNNLRNLYNSTPIQIKLAPEADNSYAGKLNSAIVLEPKTPARDKLDLASFISPRENFNARSSNLKQNLADDYLRFINSATKEELKSLRGIGEKRATYILELREESPEPFKSLEDLKEIGLSAKQINGMMKKVAGDLFN